MRSFRPRPSRREIWLDANVRVRTTTGVVALLALVAAASLSVAAILLGGWLLAAAAACAAAVFAPAFAVWSFMRHPRIAFDGRLLSLYLGRGAAVRVPLDAVECFFIGSAPLASGGKEEVSTRTVIVRFAEAAAALAEGPTDRRIAKWCGGYITLYGAWCEPFDAERLRLLNHQLAVAKRAAKEASEAKESA